MRTCLVVDDSSVIRKVARRILEGLDFQIVEAEDGEKALEVCKRGLPDAVLLDWNMPVMDGYEFLGNLRRMPGGDQPKVVFCTTENDVAHIERIKPDVAVLDIEVPELDGISALPQLLAKKRDLIIIMASTLTRRNAEISFKALSLGASDYIPKPESTREAAAAEIFHHDLIQ